MSPSKYRPLVPVLLGLAVVGVGVLCGVIVARIGSPYLRATFYGYFGSVLSRQDDGAR